MTLQVVRDDNERIVRSIGIATDVQSRKQSEERQRLVADVSGRLSGSLDLKVSLRTLLDALVPSFASCAFVSVGSDREPEKRVTAALHHDIIQQAELGRIARKARFDPEIDTDVVAELLGGHAFLSDFYAPFLDGTPLIRELHATLTQLGMRCAAIVPFVGSGALLGTLVLARAYDRPRFSEAEIACLDELAPRIFATIANARLYERERRVAHLLQRASLPATLPATEEVDFSAHYIPGANEALIGGDWYDAMRLEDGRIFISIGDVSGNGLAAAVIMGNVRQMLRSVAQVQADPAVILDATDRALRAEHPDRIVTAIAAFYDPSTSNLTYASAGHPPPYLVTSRRVSSLSAVGLPLGLREAGKGAAVTLRVPKPSHIVFYTDGLIESTRDNLQGESKLVEELKLGEIFSDAQPSARLIDRLLADEARDDVAVLIACVSAERDKRRGHWVFDARDPRQTTRVLRQFTARLESLRPSEEDMDKAQLVFESSSATSSGIRPARPG